MPRRATNIVILSEAKNLCNSLVECRAVASALVEFSSLFICVSVVKDFRIRADPWPNFAL